MTGTCILQRRRFLTLATGWIAAAKRAVSIETQDQHRGEAMLMGSCIGDALGGPLEFAEDEIRRGRVASCRRWSDDRRLDSSEIDRLGRELRLFSYKQARPQTAPYGPWVSSAPAGTVTDDTRLKIILIRAMRAAVADGDRHWTHFDIAREFIHFRPRLDTQPDKKTKALVDEGLREYAMASRWLLGDRNLESSRPVERLWSGVPNCSGQMMMLPLSICFRGRPNEAYQQCYRYNVVDNASAKDLTSAIVAGLSDVLSIDRSASSTRQRWSRFESTMRAVDPFGYAEVPFVGRPLNRWLDLADTIVDRSDGRPKVAYQLLESEGKPVYFWDAHFTLLTSMVLLKITNYHPTASLRLAIDFGYDTDSYAQLMGAMIGSVCGLHVFPESMRSAVREQLKAEYDEDVRSWIEVLSNVNVEEDNQ